MIIDGKISISTERVIGATSVYGHYHFQRIMEEGCKALGYNLKYDKRVEMINEDEDLYIESAIIFID